MFRIHPFAAFRPIAAKSAEISCEPGMRLSLQEAASKVEAFPNSWLQVVRADVRKILSEPEAGTRLFERMKSEKWICQDAQPQMYVYRQARMGKKNLALIAAMEMSATIFSSLLRFQKSDDEAERQTWLRDEALMAHAEIPVLAYEQHEELSDFIHSVTNERPLAHFVGKDGATHTVWSCTDTARAAELVAQVNTLVNLSGDEMFAHATHAGNTATMLRAVALTHIGRVIVRASRILVTGGQPALLAESLREFQDSAAAQIPDNGGDPPAGFFDTYIAVCNSPNQTAATGGGSWTRRRLPPIKPDVSLVGNWDRTRVERTIINPWIKVCESTHKTEIHSMNSVIRLEQLTQFVDSGEAQAAFVFAIPSMDDLLEIARANALSKASGRDNIPHHALTFSPAIPSGLFIQSIG